MTEIDIHGKLLKGKSQEDARQAPDVAREVPFGYAWEHLWIS